jgi:hypothetical protein
VNFRRVCLKFTPRDKYSPLPGKGGQRGDGYERITGYPKLQFRA